MSTQELVYKYKLEVNKLDSQDFVDLPLPTILTLLNKGILMYVDAVYGVNNIFRQGVESSQRRIDDLQDIIVKDYSSTYVSSDFNKYYAPLADNYLHLLRSWSTADKSSCNCTDRKLRNIEYSNDELNDILISKDPNRYPSFEWKELPVNISQDKVWAYTDGTFVPTKCYTTYLKYPNQVDLAGYEHIDGSPSTDVQPDLPDYVLEDVVSLTAQFTKAILDDVQGYQILSKEILSKI